ncbi:hypothetical protein TNCV_3227321 [Trichonephila clavipes]|nr:hypothetical protein TNCV_3227321 [Trichonephila clavipes]
MAKIGPQKSVMFHQDNARPHTSVVTRQNLWELEKDPESESAREAIQSGDSQGTFGQCVPRAVTHYPVEYCCGQALKVRKDNRLQHLGDVALAV